MLSEILTPNEYRLLTDASLHAAKSAIDAKISDLFSALKTEIEAIHGSEGRFLPADVLRANGRHYRGEHLGDLPWRALDCPRCFAGPDMFAFRSLIVWGQGISFHLLVGGRWLDTFRPQLAAAHAALSAQPWTLCQAQSPWHWTPDGHLHVSALDEAAFAAHVAAAGWLKLSQWHPMDIFPGLPAQGAGAYRSLLALLSMNA